MSNSRLEILTPATSLALLSPEELRAAAGLDAGDTSQDASLEALGLEAAEWIADICQIRSAGSNTPTVLAEEIRESFPPYWHGPELILARRYLSDVSVSENGMALADGTDFVVLDDKGTVQRYLSGWPTSWQLAPIVVEYTAGFSTGSPGNLPAAIKAVARDYVRMRYGVGLVLPDDIRVRSEQTVDIDTVSYFDASSVQSSFEAQARQRLSRYICFMFA